MKPRQIVSLFVCCLTMLGTPAVGLAAPDDDDEVTETPPDLPGARPRPHPRRRRAAAPPPERRVTTPPERRVAPPPERRVAPPPERRTEPPPPVRPAAKPPRVTLLLDVADADQKTLKRVLAAVRAALKADQRIKYIPFQRLLERPRGSLKRIRRGIRLMEKAQEDLTNLELAKAIPRLEKAVQLFEYSFLGLIRIKAKARPLADALRMLATAYFLDGQVKKAKEFLQRLLVLAPKTRFSPKLFPKQMAQLVDDERLLFDEFGTSTLEITTTPPGARVYLNARRIGRGPLKRAGVRRGFHYLTARMPGYKTTTMGVEVDPPKLSRVTIKLRRFKRDPAPDMARSFTEMGQRRPGPGLTALAARLKVDMIVIGKAAPDQDLGSITLHVYDFRLKELLKGPVTSRVSLDFPKAKVGEAVRMVLAGIPLDGTRPEPPKTKTRKKSAWKSFREGWMSFRRWKGFWPTVGSVAGILVAGAVVGLAVGLQPRGQIEPRGWRHVVLGHTLRF